MSGSSRCDACDKRLRKNHHELLLRDLLTGQVVGHYHAGLAWASCQAQAAKYSRPGVALRMSFVHPDRCGTEQEKCDAGVGEVAA